MPTLRAIVSTPAADAPVSICGCVDLGDVGAARQWADRATAVDEVTAVFTSARDVAMAQGAHGTARRIAGRAADLGVTLD